MKKIYFVLISWFTQLSAIANTENFPVGARASAMGNATVALSDVWSSAHNQAGLGFIRNTTTGIYYENRFLLKELSIRNAVLAIPLKAGTIGAAITNSGYSSYNENKYSLSFANVFSNTLSIGMALNYLRTQITEENGNFATLIGEVGVQAKLQKSLVIGAHLYNPTRAVLGKNTTERVPTIMRVGIHYIFSEKVSITAETEKDLSKSAMLKAGIEYQPVNNFYLRIGISSDPVLTSWGIGFQLQNFQVDLSANYHQTLGITPQFGLTYLFNKGDKTVLDDN